MIVKRSDTPQITAKILPPERQLYVRLNRQIRKNYFLWKRIVDCCVSFLLIVGVMSWLVPLLGILIKLDSPGPVFFLQRRMGKGGRVFTCIKFRSMVKNEQADWCPAFEQDPRLTGLGKFLRRTNIDELPQLFNVLAGSMSLIGPRPYMLSDCRKFALLVQGHHYRNLIKPGITGLSQVKGLHGFPTSVSNIQRRFQWDTFYIRNASMELDMRIIGKSVLLFFTQRPLL